jgi:hypothetical protein
MTGILNLTSTGLILAETWETDLSAWTSTRVGGTTAAAVISTEAAHSGSKSVDFQTGADWPDAGYLKLTQTVDLKAGANRIARCFRGLGNVKGAVFDDFLGSTLDSSRWSGSGGPISASVIKICDSSTYYPIATVPQLRPYNPGRIRIAAKFRVGATGKQIWRAFQYPGGGGAGFKFGTGTYQRFCPGDGPVGWTAVDANMHIWELEWNGAGSTSFWLDGVSVRVSPFACNDSDGYVSRFELQNPTDTKGDHYLEWLADSMPAAYKSSLLLGSQTLFDVDPVSDTNPLDGTWADDTNGWMAVTPTGSQTVELKVRNASGYKQQFPVHMFFDDLAIMLDTVMTIKGLLGGQKIELYDSGGVLRKSGICPLTGTDVVFTGIDALIKTAYGFQGYFKIYDTDGVTLLYTSPTASRWGGDVYTWIPNESAMDVTTTYTRIFRTGSGLTPTSCVVTVTLKDKQTGAKLNGKTINWIGNLGTVSPSSNSTDVNGNASTTFTAQSSAGLGGVRPTSPGDATYGTSTILQLIDIYQADPVPDATKDFQAFIEGQEIAVSAGDYKLASDFMPQPFSVTTPTMTVSVGGWWVVEIYRLGVKEFIGRIMKANYRSGTSAQLTISGVDDTVTLQRRVANKGYTDEPKNIINDLLIRYPCGITAGTISTYGSTINLVATYENLFDALRQISKITGWKFRRNSSNNTIDFATDFGSVKSVTVAMGTNEVGASHDFDWTSLDTKVYVVGKGPSATLVSSASDATSELTFGLIEEAFLEKGITVQGTLDLRAAELLNQHKAVKEIISVDWTDLFATGAYVPFDTITVTDADATLSGSFRVYSIRRNLSNANKVTLELTNRLPTVADALQIVRSTVQDLGVA